MRDQQQKRGSRASRYVKQGCMQPHRRRTLYRARWSSVFVVVKRRQVCIGVPKKNRRTSVDSRTCVLRG